MRKAALHNLGCKVNSYETEAMTQLLKKAGYEIVSFQDQADVYIINTCSVTNMADRKSRQMLHKAKKQNPNAVVVATGCYVQTATEKVAQDLSIDLVVGNNRKKDIVEILNEYYEEKEAGEQVKEEYVIDINHTDEYEDLEISTVTEHTRAHLKIQDGCNNFCSYCIIPYARGRIRSRTMESIKAELERLSASGFKEIVLTGINLSCYDDNGKKLIDVIEMADNVNGIERIRLGSLDPEVVTEDFVERLGKVKKICPHFHFSLQSGCDKTLKAMNRHYTSDEYYEKCQLIRKYIDNPAFTTDVIVGFPGETEEDYISSREFVKKVKFAELHVFKYSKRDGTVAAKMPNQIDEKIKTLRSEDLIKTGEELTKEFRQAKIGQDTTVLFEEKILLDNKEYWVGHTVDYIKIAVPEKENLEGQIRKVNVKDFLTNEIMLATM
ncbi:tRNA (N(6)-L-threonylcarbamoyladenosine(37)-C(2))-methylthiotransferase MtaB [Eubacterium ventriosum]|jgi:threonylcarbamoyladenosine tRNA methylthiotransferase MtaB|uniref:Threonylcarbamoyladenosine tRNA methylthiotransferase MtaB n=1 Tax=Eubacterium ventriosum TaxID=39496 RepID=A0A413RWD9_9FIRM|nr:tRNA (N(6)-L-threonylcarbamoyladenosine(37)-C(2))-methylthiotransferase MtaB [Eubacterium ventriosum]MEE0855065.1 tRNA (N(6)-L-threonylcarbamoyladenosine(37)-C(2))-methylthiotransferase MtaB [Eubacterium ventriosum]RHA52694.1 tRNA (N(6)-L-threonylcarbamoyladenosine(37)-C(2))-methylthiotransferase MtaB [Eubacterium ventriosum]RHF86950.1 tRNA (N(6)-L-threonylcarbamoyladenosine(37)-C(2))-methylthiotransferase MtaB [Eubacterium ventriosum]